ncbi:unknown [Clostridium sp. CAG:448]|nr:unknown [Clostridium sp. CAG:448]
MRKSCCNPCAFVVQWCYPERHQQYGGLYGIFQTGSAGLCGRRGRLGKPAVRLLPRPHAAGRPGGRDAQPCRKQRLPALYQRQYPDARSRAHRARLRAGGHAGSLARSARRHQPHCRRTDRLRARVRPLFQRLHPGSRLSVPGDPARHRGTLRNRQGRMELRAPDPAPPGHGTHLPLPGIYGNLHPGRRLRSMADRRLRQL